MVLSLCLAGCHDAKPPAAARSDGGTAQSPPRPATTPVDAAPEIDAMPLRAQDVLVGPAAEQAIATMPTAPARDGLADETAPGEDGADDDPPHPGIRGDGYGPLRLGQSRAEVARLLGVPGALHKKRTAPGQPSVEVALLPGELGKVYLEVRVYAGRLESLIVVGADKRAVTDRGIGVGATFEDAMEAHGAPRRVDDDRTNAPRGWVMADLAGVIFVPTDAATLGDEAPTPTDRVARLLIVGSAATAPND